MLLSSPSPARRGNVTIVVAVCCTVLFGFVAVSVDGGLLQSERSHAQSVADASALAAASVLFETYPNNQGADSEGKAQQAALDCAQRNGYGNDGTTSSVVVHIPPTSGPYSGKPGYAEVVVTYYQARFFSRLFADERLPVRARAVARGAWVAPNVGVLVLAYSGRAALSVQGNGAVTATGAPVIVNSNNASAVVDAGNGTLKASEFYVAGTYFCSGNGQLITSPVPNSIFTGVHPTPDPLAYLPVPDVPTPGQMTKTALGGGSYQYTLSPGAYYNLPNFSSGDKVVLQQASAGNGGIFYLAAGGLNSQGASISMDPDTTGGVMLYNAGTGTSDAISITGNPDGNVNLRGLTSGIYRGLTVFQARDAPQDMKIAGNGAFTILGTIYAAEALLQVTGNGSVSNIGSQYVTKELALSGNGNVGISWNGNEVARTRIVSLVE